MKICSAVVAFLLVLSSIANSQTAPGFHIEQYAVVNQPVLLAFDPNGVLYVGRGGGNGAAQKIHRVSAGGAQITEYGNEPISDPDAVVVDVTGTYSGVPGSVLVGGGASPTGPAQIHAILPDQSVGVPLGGFPFGNCGEIKVDYAGRLVFADLELWNIYATTGGTPSILTHLPSSPLYLAIDAQNNIYVSTDDGKIRVLNPDGSELNGEFATFQSRVEIEFGPGGAWGTDLYAMDYLNGVLYRINPQGSKTAIGSSFGVTQDIAFGPDGALYISDFSNNRILRVTPDCNGNGIPDDQDIGAGASSDCNGNGIPDECDIAVETSQDCNGNGVPDECDISGTWQQAATTGPGARANFGLAYDIARSKTVLFSGNIYSGSVASDTWEWDGTIWALRSTSGPTPRNCFGMDYDSRRNKAVLFGGNLIPAQTLAGDTWEWNGAAWVQVAVAGPSPRYFHAMAFDSARGVTVLFGGLDANGFNSGETWEWDGISWTLRANTGPTARHAHAMAYDSARGVTVLFGGDDGGVRGDTWEWDGVSWALRATTGPEKVYRHAMSYDARSGATVLFGGDSYTASYTWLWGGTTWTLKSTIGPTARWDHRMVFDASRGVTVAYGGGACCPSLAFDDTWELPSRSDCNGNGIPDECDISSGFSADFNHNGYPDECEGCVGPLLITQQPAPSQSVCETGFAQFSVAASRTSGLTFQWRKYFNGNFVDLSDGGSIAGAHGATLVVGPLSVTDAGAYDVIVTGLCGETVTSDPANLFVGQSVVIFNQPHGLNACAGTLQLLQVDATGTPPLTYQWRKNGVALSGQTSQLMVFNPITPVNAGSYDVIVTGVDCSLQSAAAQVVVYTKLGDLNLDGRVDLSDLSIILANYGALGASTNQGDLDNDTDVDLADLAIMLSVYG